MDHNLIKLRLIILIITTNLVSNNKEPYFGSNIFLKATYGSNVKLWSL